MINLNAPPSPCPACAAALVNKWAGVTYIGCRSCLVREVSHAPAHLREVHYRRIEDEAERAEFMAAVLYEFRRRSAMEVA